MYEEILCITHKYPPFTGGMEKQSYELIQGLSSYYKVHIIAFEGKENKLLWFLKLKSRVKKLLKANPNIKLIHLNDGAMGVAALWLQKITQIPVVVTYHGLDITYPLTFFQKKLIPKLIKYKGAVCVSKFTSEQCIKRGFDPRTTFIVNNGVDLKLNEIPFDSAIAQKLGEKYGIDVSGKNIIMVTGRPVKRKGFSWFLKNVMPLLYNDVILILTGPLKKSQTFFDIFLRCLPKMLRHKIQLLFGFPDDNKEVIEQLKKQRNAFHLGRVSNEDLMQIISLADLFVMPNINIPGDVEGFGLVALEASVRGTYVLASKVQGITDAVIDMENGTLLPCENAEAWADKIKEMLSDKEKLKILSEKGRNFTIQHFSWQKMVDEYIQVFNGFIH